MNDIAVSSFGLPVQFAPLIALANPDLYAANAFRLLEISIESKSRDLDRRSELMERAARVGVTVPPGSCRVFPRTPAPDEHDLREAAHAIEDSEMRLAQEFFWFWPMKSGSGASDPALQHLTEGRSDEANSCWREATESQPVGVIAKHNLAVFHHFSALEIERVRHVQTGSMKSSDDADPELSADYHWHETMQYWEDIAEDEAFWEVVTTRIRVIGDVSLPTGASRRLRSTLPIVLTLISARLALRAAGLGRLPDAERHVARIRRSRLDSFGIDRGLRQSLLPQCALVKLLCEEATRDAGADHEHADTIVERLLVQAEQPLTAIDLILSNDHPLREAEHDRVASTALSCQIMFGNKTGNSQRCLELIDRIAPIASSATIKQKLARDREIDLRNVEAGLCWFCGENQFDDKCAVKVNMHGDVQRTYNSLQWRHTTVSVPRCKECATEETKIAAIAFSAAALAFLLGVITGFLTEASGIDNGGGEFLFGMFIGAPAAGVIAFLFAQRMFSRRREKRGRPAKLRTQGTFPGIVKLIEQGWKAGEKPQGAQ